MKKLTKLEKYVRVPDTQFYGAYFYDGEDIELHNETEIVDDKSLTIIDTIENGVFHKHKELKVEETGLVEITDTTYPVSKGQMLVFIENLGFVEVKGLIGLNDAINRLKMLDSTNFDEEGKLKEE